ncbi:MAG: SDR family NAD(P)-dependent oxidoreductase [Pseudomonadota bacterium]
MKSLLVTGASSGIGKALALHAAELGWKVTATGRNRARLEELASQHANIDFLTFDITKLDECRIALSGRHFDTVILNAGTCEYVDIEVWEPEMFKRVFDANFFGAVNCLEALLPSLTKGDQLVFVDSLARLLPFTRSQAYGASKAALHYLGKVMEVDLAERGVTVQTVSPGFVQTPLTDRNTFKMPMRISAEEAATTLLSAVECGSTSIHFPRIFSTLIRALASLPYRWQVFLCRRMKIAENAKS